MFQFLFSSFISTVEEKTDSLWSNASSTQVRERDGQLMIPQMS